jgi:hypothetical protein
MAFTIALDAKIVEHGINLNIKVYQILSYQ